MKKACVIGAGFMLALGSASAANAADVYSNDFSSNANGFTGGTILTAPSGQKFLGFGGAGGSGTLTLSGLTAHSNLSLSFSLYAIGSMDGNGYGGAALFGGGSGDYFKVTYNGSSTGTVFNQAFANYGGGEVQSYPTEGSAPVSGAATINALGYTGFPAAAGIQDAEYSFNNLLVTDSAGNISFTFFDNSNEGMANEFYGVDNIVVSTNSVAGAVPEPASWAMMIFGFGMIGAGLRFRQRRTRVRYLTA